IGLSSARAIVGDRSSIRAMTAARLFMTTPVEADQGDHHLGSLQDISTMSRFIEATSPSCGHHPLREGPASRPGISTRLELVGALDKVRKYFACWHDPEEFGTAAIPAGLGHCPDLRRCPFFAAIR